MKKHIQRLLFATLAILLGGANSAWAATLTDVPYAVDFNTSIAVPSNNHSDPMFQVATGWTRIADRKAGDNYYGTAGYYMRYTYSSNAGVDGTGTLLANAQQAPQSTYDGTIETVHDYIVTPKVSGTVTLQVKGSTSATNSLPSYINFYEVDDDATTVGDEIVASFSEDLNTDNFVTATLTLEKATRIAIRGQWVYMDNFIATSAEVPEVKAITVTSVMNSDGQSGYTGTNPVFEQQSDGKLLVKLKVSIQNTGNVDITASTAENYTLTLASASSESAAKTYYDDATINITEDLPIGKSTTINVETTVNYNDTYGSHRYWFVRENLTGTTSSSYRYATSLAYEPKFVFRVAESTSTNSLSSTQAYGLVSENTTKNYEIANTGTAPLTIKSITLPEGFESANMPVIPTEGLTIAKGATQALDITLPATTLGSYSGNLVIVYLDATNTEKTYTLTFSGSVLPAGTWAADFNGASAVVYPTGSIAEGGINSDSQYADGVYDYYIKGSTYSSYATENNKFITPKLHATAGQQLTFDVKGVSGASYYAKVYVSTDRKTWGDPVAYYTYGEKAGAEAIGSSNWVNKAITFDAEGDYYVAFSLYGEFKIDNIIGLTKADVAHDLYIKSVTWPDASVNSGVALSSRPSVEVIPLTTESANAYTVKYVCGETVLAEGTPIALTASASSSTTFAFNWTPEVESTTAYANTKVVFDFGGGVTFETETFDLTVVKEPIFHFVKALPSNKYNEPSDHTTPISFGKTTTADAQTFYVYNWGTAALNVKSITVPEGFTITPANQFTVAAFDENNLSAAAQAVEITFSATESGTYSGNMVITYVDGNGADQTFELAVSGTKLDPSKFYANFDDGSWPAGSVYQSNVSSSNGGTYSEPNYYISSSSSTNNIFVTPKLKAVAGDKLLFDAKLYNEYSSWSNGSIKVYAAATREEVLNTEEGTKRQLLYYASGSDTEADATITASYNTFESTITNSGDYFFGFEISGGAKLDEIYGLQQVAVAHDWQIASSSIPAEVMQNTEATATINIRNLGLTAEAANSYKATLYVDEEPVATVTETAAIPTVNQLSATGTQISIPFHYGVVGTVKAYIVVEAADGYKVNTDAVDINFTGEIATADGKQVGTQSGTGRDYGFVDWYNNDGSTTRYTDILYPADKIGAAGIKAGDKITSISFKASNSAKTFKAVVTSWVGLSTGDITYGSPVKVDMQEVEVYNGSIAFPANVESVITLSSPIVWDGTSDIRVYTEAVGQGSSNWMSANYAYDSSINMSYNGSTKAAPVAFFTLAAEPAATLAGTVKLGGTPVEGATVTLTSKDADKVQYTGTTNASGEYSIEVIQSSRTYTVTADYNGAAATVENVSDFSAPVNLALVALPELTFGDADFSTTETKANVTVTRGLKAGWNAIILPVTLTADEVTSAFGANAEVAVYSKDEDAENVTIQFSKTTKIVAGTPCLLWLEAAPATAPRFVNKDINTTVNKVSGQSFSFTGVYEATTVKAGDYFVKNGGFKKAGNNNTVKPFRSYLQLNEGASARSIRFFIDDEEIVESEITGIETVKQTVAPQGTYSMSGQKMEGKLRKGLYIINGKKVMVK